MLHATLRSLRSALTGGAAAFLIAPLLWPFVVYIEQGHFSSTLFAGLLAVSAFALAAGLVVALLVGFPLLVLLQRLRLTNPLLVVVPAALTSAVVFSKFLSWPLSAWPLYGYFLIVGGFCGGVAAWKNAL
jgi:hypothetical protein